MPGDNFYFEGFSSPNGTIVPDEVFDVLMPQLSNAELRVTLYIVRRTFGFKKSSDDISLRQMVEGITTRNGRILDRGTGLSKASVARGVKGLVEKGIIEKTRNQSAEKGYEATSYRLRFKQNNPLSHYETRHVSEVKQGHVSPADIQQTEVQTTDRQREDSNNLPRDFSEEDLRVIESVIRDFAREMNDRAPLSSSVTRSLRLWHDAGVDRETFVGALYVARSRTQQYTGSIKHGDPGRRNKMPYFFRVLEDVLSGNAEHGS